VYLIFRRHLKPEFGILGQKANISPPGRKERQDFLDFSFLFASLVAFRFNLHAVQCRPLISNSRFECVRFFGEGRL